MKKKKMRWGRKRRRMTKYRTISEKDWNWRVGYWAIRSSARSFARPAHSFACSALLASLARSAALIRSLALSLTRSRAHGKVVYVFEMNASISYSFNPLCKARKKHEQPIWRFCPVFPYFNYMNFYLTSNWTSIAVDWPIRFFCLVFPLHVLITRSELLFERHSWLPFS